MTDEDLQNLHDWGVKIIRLGVMWESVEKSPGIYDEIYLGKIDELISRMGSYGIHTIIDNH